jgi:MFS family permease
MQQSVSATPPVHRDASATRAYAWALVAMLWAVSFCNYADRSVLSAVMPQIRTEFGLSLPQLGLLSSAFLWVYAIAASPAGYIGDRFSRKKVIVAGLVAWSIVTFLSPLAGSFTVFLLLRGADRARRSKLLPDWHRADQRLSWSRNAQPRARHSPDGGIRRPRDRHAHRCRFGAALSVANAVLRLWGDRRDTRARTGWSNARYAVGGEAPGA